MLGGPHVARGLEFAQACCRHYVTTVGETPGLSILFNKYCCVVAVGHGTINDARDRKTAILDLYFLTMLKTLALVYGCFRLVIYYNMSIVI